MPVLIADTACVDPRARLADAIEVGPFCIVGPAVALGRATRLIAHVCLSGKVEVGERNEFYPFTSIGAGGRDAQGGAVEVAFGVGNVLREGVVIEPGSGESGPTRVGDRCRIGAGARLHAACSIGSQALLGDGVVLGARASVGNGATLASGVTVHRDTTLGEYCFVASGASVTRDVPPYLLVDGRPARVRGLNTSGLRRAGIEGKAHEALREAWRLLYRAGVDPRRAIVELAARGLDTPEVRRLLAFLQYQVAGRHGRARDRGRTAGHTSEPDEAFESSAP